MPRKTLKSVFVPFLERLRRPFQRPRKLANKEKHAFKYPMSQEFCIPSNIIYYIARNPSSPKGHLKLISTCKFLARMNRILPVKRVENDSESDDDKKWKVNNEVSLNLKNNKFKIWVSDNVQIWKKSMPNLASTLINHVYKFSLRRMTIQNQVFTFGELQFLVSGSNLDHISFEKNVIKNDDGSITEFEKVFELLSCCKDFVFFFPNEQHGVGRKTTSKIIDMLSSDQAALEKCLFLASIPQDFDFHLFSQFLKENMTGRQHSIDLVFSRDSCDAYKNQLQQFIDEIIQIRGIYAHTVPLINFRGQNREAYHELEEMRYGYVEGILRK